MNFFIRKSPIEHYTLFLRDTFKMTFIKIIIIGFFFVILSCQKVLAQNPVNWTNEQLIEPADLTATINSKKDIPLLFSVGPGATIPYSKDIGVIKEAENLEKFKDQLANVPKKTKIVVYCGCCPFEHCPNVRPAMQVLKDLV
jgi:thiosulfate/3-mercaptopyruvate sulfurtransferase